MNGDPTGPQHHICLACAVPQLDDDGQVVTDSGWTVYHCADCIARHADRWCECFECMWLWREEHPRWRPPLT